jgi:hypothetical protein
VSARLPSRQPRMSKLCVHYSGAIPLPQIAHAATTREPYEIVWVRWTAAR